MSSHGKKTLIENTLALALMGILAGAIGGLAVGIATSPKTASNTTSASSIPH
jgi:type II secretory pathway pseudopilin PulG